MTAAQREDSNSSPLPSCTVVIATLDRLKSLKTVLDCLAAQTVHPDHVIVSVAGDPEPARKMLSAYSSRLSIDMLVSEIKSSAKQRNQAAAKADSDVIAFLDDDIEFGASLMEEVLAQFQKKSAKELGALSPRIANQGASRPGRLTRIYYRIQAGYTDADYGGHLFGPGINCFPLYEDETTNEVSVQWLPATCLFIRSDLFQRQWFPEFDGYSFAEDVHLTARIGRESPLFFLREPSILHHSMPSEFKRNRTELTAGKLHNMGVVARQVMGIDGWRLRWKWELHRLFLLSVLLLRRPRGWRGEITGVLKAKLS